MHHLHHDARKNILSLQGSTLFDENFVIRNLGHFNRERIPERVVHAKGNTYYGVFHATNPLISEYTIASVFQPGQRTRVAVRFSTQVSERGSADTVFGEVRGMGIKFYGEEGNYDMLCINMPVFFINDPQFFTHINHAQKRNPQSDLKDGNMMWDFFSNHVESWNALTILYSDYGLPDGYRFMPSFAINAFRLVNHQGHHVYVKFTWVPDQGIKNLNYFEALRLAGKSSRLSNCRRTLNGLDFCLTNNEIDEQASERAKVH